VLIPDQPSGNPVTDRVSAFRKADAALDVFLNGFECREAVITRDLMAAASEIVAQFNLNAHDAVVAALARDLRISHIASLDRDFRRIDGIDLWDGLLVD
jgi:predicted nucleic acid-binding protein